MFHIEDVYDMAGVPAILNPNIAMNKLMNCHVNLTARSICKEMEPKNIFSVQRKLLQEDRGAIPLLQAASYQSSTSNNNTYVLPGSSSLSALLSESFSQQEAVQGLDDALIKDLALYEQKANR